MPSADDGQRGLPFDPAVPNVARVYDYMLGGKENFAADRELAGQLRANAPTSAWIAQQNRMFLGRAVRWCSGQGLTQYLDIGSGLPTAENVHEVALRANPAARVVYVDNDPVAVLHATSLLATCPGVAAIEADLRQPEELLARARATGLLDLSRPVAVLVVAILHFIPDEEDPASILGTLIGAMAPGSYLVISHATHDFQPDAADRAVTLYRRASSQLVTRTREEVMALLTGLDLVEPGVVLTVQWRPEQPVADPPGAAGMYAAVAARPSAKP